MTSSRVVEPAMALTMKRQIGGRPSTGRAIRLFERGRKVSKMPGRK